MIIVVVVGIVVVVVKQHYYNVNRYALDVFDLSLLRTLYWTYRFLRRHHRRVWC